MSCPACSLGRAYKAILAKRQREMLAQEQNKNTKNEEPQIIEAPQEEIAEAEVVAEKAIEGEQKED